MQPRFIYCIGRSETDLFKLDSATELRRTQALDTQQARAESSPALRPISARRLGFFSPKLPQNHHPERSASQIHRLTQRLVARSRRTSAVLILPMLLEAFRPPRPATVFPWGREPELASIKCMKRCTRDYQVRIAADPVVGLSGVEKLRTAWVK